MDNYQKRIFISFVVITVLFLAGLVAAIIVNFNDIDKTIISTVMEKQRAGFFLFSPPVKGSTPAVAINSVFSETSVYPFSIDKQIYNFSISGEVDLEFEDSLARVILIDKDGKEYLVYEAYPLITETKNGPAKINNTCDETCVLDGIKPASLKIQIENASVELKDVLYSDSSANLNSEVKQKGIKNYNQELKKAQDKSKINQINKKIKETGKGWTAGETSVSKLGYSEKKALFDKTKDLPNLQGFEYYTAGVFDLKATFGKGPGGGGGGGVKPAPILGDLIPYPSPSPTVVAPDAWDWRNRHAENWMSPVKNQGGCGSCWAFSTIGAVEGVINLYYNQHLNIDLSEQELVSCSSAGTCSGGNMNPALSYIKNTGVVEEACFPYQGVNTACAKCSDWQSRLWKIVNYGSSSTADDAIKTILIEKGTLTFGVLSWSHALTLAGYYKDASGQTVWVLKNSWGSGWGEAGYAKMIIPVSDRSTIDYAQSPFFVSNQSLYQISCVNKDGDSYCNWGLPSAKPASCPASCSSQQEDCDDSNSEIGVCAFSQEIKAYSSVCREYLAAECTQSTICPSGYYRVKTASACSGTGKNKIFWSFCVRDFSYCGKCPQNSYLSSYNYCASGQVCSVDRCVTP